MHRRDRRFRNDSTVLFHRFPSNLALASAVEGWEGKNKGASPGAEEGKTAARGAVGR